MHEPAGFSTTHVACNVVSNRINRQALLSGLLVNNKTTETTKLLKQNSLLFSHSECFFSFAFFFGNASPCHHFVCSANTAMAMVCQPTR